MQITFEAEGPSWASSGQQNPAFQNIYYYSQKNVSVLPGDSPYYSPSNIPQDAQPGVYYLVIRLSWVNDDGTTGTHQMTSDFFHVPGSLATNITTYLTDRGTPTSVVGASAGAGEAIVYKITVTNTGYPSENQTNVVLGDQLPPEIFAVISYPDRNGTVWPSVATDHGVCSATGSWPNNIVACQLGSLAPGETATIAFTASIIVRNPSGAPSPPKNFNNKVSINSDQQRQATSSVVKTAISKDVLSDADYNKFVSALTGCTAAAVVAAGGVEAASLATFAGLFAAIMGEVSGGGSVLKAATQNLIQDMFSKEIETLSHQVGLGKAVSERLGTGPDMAECLWEGRAYFM